MASLTPNMQLALNYDVGAVWSAGRSVSKGEIAYPSRWNGYGYQAIQAATARTGTSEPVWPTAVGGTVVDGGVTWQAHQLGALTWTSDQLYVLGISEPSWPTTIGVTVNSGTTQLKVTTPVVPDALCPHSTAILSAASKMFAVDDDVVRYSATVNPLGWDPTLYPADAGYLDTGSMMGGEPVPNALAMFRGNMAVMGNSSVQIWQLDPDPARIAIVDTIEGVGTPYPRAHAAVQGDLLFTTPKGVRSLTAATQNEGVGTLDVGTPVDELVRAALAALPAGSTPIARYHPGLSEFWLFVGATAYVLRQSKLNGFAGWTRYTLPGTVTDATVMGTDLYFLVGTTGKVYKVDVNATSDSGTAIAVSGETPYFELTPDGTDAMILGVDCVAGGPFNLVVGYDESDPTGGVTGAYTMPAKSKPDGMIPVMCNAVSAANLRWSASVTTAWSLDELQLHFEPLGTR